MVCNICERENQRDSTACTYCGSALRDHKNNATYFEYSNTERGFSKPESEYRKAEVIKSSETAEVSYIGVSPIAKKYREPEFDYYQNCDKIQDGENELIVEPKEIKIDQKEFTSFHQYIKESINIFHKNIGTKKIIIILSVMSTAIILILSASFILNKVNEYKFTLKANEVIEIYYNRESRETFVYNSNGEVLHQLNDTAIPIWYAQNCSSALLKSEINNSLYYVNDNKQILLKTNTHSMSMSLDGKLLYSSSESEVNQLRLLDVERQTDTVIEEDMNLNYIGVCISPDGRSYAYTKGPLLNSNDYSNAETFISINGGEPASIGKGIIAFMISDNCSYLCYVKIKNTSEYEFYVEGDSEPVLLTNEIHSIGFNQHYSEIIFTDSHGTYISSKGKESIKVSDSQIRELVAPIKTTKNVLNGGTVYPVTSFKNKVFTTADNTLIYIDGNYQSKLLASLSNVNNIMVSRDWNELIYVSIVGDITEIGDLSGKMKKEILAEGVEEFVVSSDLKQIYYMKKIYYAKDSAELQLLLNQPVPIVNPLYELYYKKGNADPIMIASQVSDYQLNAAGDIAFFIKLDSDLNSRLYSSTKGGEATPVEGFETVDSLEKWNYGIVVKEKIHDRFNIYYNTSEKDFKLILENVSEPINSLTIQ